MSKYEGIETSSFILISLKQRTELKLAPLLRIINIHLHGYFFAQYHLLCTTVWLGYGLLKLRIEKSGDGIKKPPKGGLSLLERLRVRDHDEAMQGGLGQINLLLIQEVDQVLKIDFPHIGMVDA